MNSLYLESLNIRILISSMKFPGARTINFVYFIFAAAVLVGFNWNDIKEAVPEKEYILMGMGMESNTYEAFGTRALLESSYFNASPFDANPKEDSKAMDVVQTYERQASAPYSSSSNYYYYSPSSNISNMNEGDKYWDSKKVEDQFGKVNPPPRPFLAVHIL